MLRRRESLPLPLMPLAQPVAALEFSSAISPGTRSDSQVEIERVVGTAPMAAGASDARVTHPPAFIRPCWAMLPPTLLRPAAESHLVQRACLHKVRRTQVGRGLFVRPWETAGETPPELNLARWGGLERQRPRAE